KCDVQKCLPASIFVSHPPGKSAVRGRGNHLVWAAQPESILHGRNVRCLEGRVNFTPSSCQCGPWRLRCSLLNLLCTTGQYRRQEYGNCQAHDHFTRPFCAPESNM